MSGQEVSTIRAEEDPECYECEWFRSTINRARGSHDHKNAADLEALHARHLHTKHNPEGARRHLRSV
jgi:hypothetical protein